MNKADLSLIVAEKHGFNQAEAERVVNTVINSMKNALANKERIQFIGFGSFEVVDRAERTINNPQTKEPRLYQRLKLFVLKQVKSLKN